MYVVIFRATSGALDDDYAATAAALRELALREHGCLGFHAVSEGDAEIALSYWPSLEAIAAWKARAEHLIGQKRGREGWYTSYRVEIARIERAYEFPTAAAAP